MEQHAGRKSTTLVGHHLTKGQARMRRSVALVLAMVAGVVLIGCEEAATGGSGGGSSAGGASSSSPISPPSWIIGTWRDATATLTWTFTADNAVHTGSGISQDFRELARTAGGTVSDTSPSATQYRIILETSSLSGRYDFHKAGSDTIEYSITAGGLGSRPNYPAQEIEPLAKFRSELI